MSGRFKRHISKASTSTGDASGGSSAMARKKRKMENVSSDDEERLFWTANHLGDLKAYNRSSSEKPDVLIRKDLISAMKLADNEPLTIDDYWGISDHWKQEWEKGVQVPVNPNSLPEPSVKQLSEYPKSLGDFRFPKRFIRVTHSDFFNNERHVLSNLPTKAEKMCRYDMDNLDDAWLKAYNGERARMGAVPVPHHIFELIIEHLEETCWENIHKQLKAEETLSIEYDEDVICDVCRSPDREEGNEMVFCDDCNICVHQACYGITAIPSGPWLCRTCDLAIKPNCDLCPNKGGAMKSTKSGHKWAHVACALWIPEVSIGSVERMEPITKIPNIHQSRRALVCVLCRERRGACIQCSVKTCKTAYHVTCAFKHGLEMKAIVEDENADAVKLRSYCEKHSISNKKDTSDADSDSGSLKKKKDLTNEQKNQAWAAKLRQIEAEFFKHVDVNQTSTVLDIDSETTETIFYYWKLKRKAGFNKPLLTPRSQELDLLSHQQEEDKERMKMFVQLRQYLERVRNLCYMVSRREKLSKSFLKTREQTFTKQAALLTEPSIKLTASDVEAITQANHSHCIYDQLYSHKDAQINTQNHFERLIKIIRGPFSGRVSDELSCSKKNLLKDINGLVKSRKGGIKGNPYRRTFVNGAEQRRSRSRSISTEISSMEDSDSSICSTKWKLPAPGTRISVFTSSEDEKGFIGRNDISCKSNLKYENSVKYYSSEEDVKRNVLSQPLSPLKSSRGRGGIVKRGRGRPRRGSKIAALFTNEDDRVLKENKIFDALMKSPAGVSPFKKECSPKTLLDYSSDEDDMRKTRSLKGRLSKKTTPIKQEALSSSEDDLQLPPKISPSKRGKGRGRGRGALKAPPNTNLLSSWSFPSKYSDDDNLGPATYKLTSEEDEKSERSSLGNDVPLCRKNLFDSDKSDVSDSEQTSKREVQHRRSRRNLHNEESDESKHSEGDSSNYNQMKTKAAMKEFIPKSSEKEKTRRGTRHSDSNEKLKVGSKLDITNDGNLEKGSKLTDIDHSTDINLFVPQRAAAKKASELITSQNIGITNNQVPLQSGSAEVSISDMKKQVLRSRDSEIELSRGPNDDSESLVKKNVVIKPRRGRSGKERLENKNEELDSEPPKRNIFEPPQILPYVPIREAARKAAENLKGAGKGGLLPTGTEEITEAPSTPKQRRGGKVEVKSQRVTRNRSPRSASKVLTSDYDADEQNEYSIQPEPKISAEDKLGKNKSIFSESDEEILATPKKEKISKVSAEKILESPKEILQKQQLFRGDILFYDHQSSSENEDDKEKKILSANRGRESVCKTTLVEKTANEWNRNNFKDENKDQSFHASKNRFNKTDNHEEHETENEEPPAETCRKAPDKKLKTSDGRPEHGFQPPVTQRDESRTSPCKQANKVFGSKSPGSEESEHKVRESGSKCRPGTIASNVSKKDLRSDINASLSIHSPEFAKGRRGARELDKGIIFKNEERTSFESLQDSKKDASGRNSEEWGKVQSEEPAKSQYSKTKAFPEKGFKSTFECISTSIQEEAPLIKPPSDHLNRAGLSAFNFTEKEVEVNRLEDIEEASDTDQEPKKVRITDSDDDHFIDRKVEQPKDSGYKSATPEPLEKIHAICNDHNQNNSLINDLITIDASSMNLGRTQESLEPKINITKFGPRRKNLEDVIEERKKAAEHTEGLTSFADSKMHKNSLDNSDISSKDLIRENLHELPLTVTDTTPNSSSSLTNSSSTSGFVEQWRRAQAIKSAQSQPVQIDTLDPTTYPHHHSGLLNDYPFPFPHMPPNHFNLTNPNDLSMYFLLLQQKYYDDRLKSGISTNQKRDEQPTVMSSHWEQANRLPIEEQKLESHLSNNFLSKSESTHLTENNTNFAVVTRGQVIDENNALQSVASLVKTTSPTKSPDEIIDVDSPSLTHVCTVLSDSLIPHSTVTTTLCKLSTKPTVTASTDISTFETQKLANISINQNSSLLSTHTVDGSGVVSIANKAPVTTSMVSVNTPIPSIASPTTALKDSPEVSTVDASTLHSPPQKRIPIYMQESKTPRVSEKRSSRNIAASPRWAKQEKKEKKQPVKTRKTPRGRAAAKGKRRGRYNAVSVPKELVGTVYEFDDDFDEDGPANNTLDDLRQLREKRQSVDAAPNTPVVSQINTQTYSTEITKVQPPKKRVKEKKIKSKEKTPKREEVDEVAKILEDYRNQQNSTLKRSVHEPSPPQIGSPFEPKKISPPSDISSEDIKLSSKTGSLMTEEVNKQENDKNEMELLSETFSTSSVVTSMPEDRTNQLKLKIKGPYANSYLNSSLNAPTQEASNPIPQSTTTTLRRMRKKELIRQYCYQDMNPEQSECSATNNSSNPPQHLRTGITLPKAVASMTSIPTREDYKMYTQDDSTSRGGNSGRRKRQPRELKQLDWTLLDDKGKRNSEGVQSGRKRQRCKEAVKPPKMEGGNKLRISFGKKDSEIITTVSNELKELKGKPPKKRHPEESTIMKVMSDNLKFREEIMANFDRSGGKNNVGEKKNRKRRLGHSSEEGSSPRNSENKDERKLVWKIPKNKSGSMSDEKGVGSSINNNNPTHPLKIRLNLASYTNSENKEGQEGDQSSSKVKVPLLKIKLQRRAEGYVTSKSEEKGITDEGPGPPPDPDPPDTNSVPHNPKPPEDLPLCKTSIEHKDGESLNKIVNLTQMPHSRISEDDMRIVEAHLAAADGGISLDTLSGHDSSHSGQQISKSESFSALQAVPPPHVEEETGCR